jgi:hypothetical protein
MKTLNIRFTFDDTNGYEGHGDVESVLKSILEREIEVSLEGDGVVKSGWKLEIENPQESGVDRIMSNGDNFLYADGDERNILPQYVVLKQAIKDGKGKQMCDHINGVQTLEHTEFKYTVEEMVELLEQGL